jgi:hypothetical protein
VAAGEFYCGAVIIRDLFYIFSFISSVDRPWISQPRAAGNQELPVKYALTIRGKRYLKYEKMITEVQKCLFLTIGLIAVAGILQYGSVSYMRTATEEKFHNLRSADTVLVQTSKLTIPDSSSNLKCLQNQFDVCGKIKNYYYDVGSTYYRNYYAFSICSILFATVLAIATFLLISSGWQNATSLIKTFFLTTIFISSFYFFLPTVLNNKENYALNLKKGKTFNQIQLNILSFSTKQYSGRQDSLSKFLGRTFDDIAANFDLETVEIHYEKLGDNPQNFLKSANPNYPR